MREWIRGLPFRSEFAIIFVAAFGWPLVGAILSLLTPRSHGVVFTQTMLLHTLLIEALVGSMLWQILVLRGWTGAQLGLSRVLPWGQEILTTSLVALGLALASYLIYATLLFAAASVRPGLFDLALQYAPRAAPGLPITTVLAAALINPVFEEVFVCGYVVSSLRERLGVAAAVNISAGIRVAYHLYQGPMAVLAIVPYALIAALWFARTKRLAPLIVAHALMDFIALSAG
jgi:membrane protease YdiL (CAAX protease family)